jgi:anti-sigma regulatory factor (Ser/Thr protein kinase)
VKKTLSLPADLGILDTVHRELVDFLAAAGAGEPIAEEMFLVAEEVLVNTISYSFDDDEAHEIELSLSVEDGSFRMRFSDDGLAYNPLDAPAPDLDAPMAKRKIGGLGVHLVKSLTDRASWAREGGRNVLVLERKVS